VRKVSKFVRLMLSMIAVGTALLAVGCGKGKMPGPEDTVLTVDDSKVKVDEMMYHVMLAEMQGQLYASFMGEDLESYWEKKNDDGVAMKDATKKMAMDNAIKYEIFYKLGKENGYTLTEEEKETSSSKALDIKKNLPAASLEKLGLTEDKLIEIQDKIAVATKYYDDYISKLGVDEEAIKETIDPAEYKQYDIQYIYAQEDQHDELVALSEKASGTEDLTELSKDTGLNSGDLSFLEGADTFGEEDNLEDEIKALEVGEVSSIIQTVKGYYIIKLVDNSSTDKYDDAVKDAVEKATEDAFEPAYEALKKEHHIKIVKKVWDKIELGNNL
jgi:foldase protein PrsA